MKQGSSMAARMQRLQEALNGEVNKRDRQSISTREALQRLEERMKKVELDDQESRHPHPKPAAAEPQHWSPSAVVVAFRHAAGAAQG